MRSRSQPAWLSGIRACRHHGRHHVDTECRLHRKASGATDGLMTAGDIARAEEQFKSARMRELANTTLINLDDLKPTPSSDEQSAALVERYRERNERSDTMHRDIANMVERAKTSEEANGRGSGFLDDQAAFRDAVARAESVAEYGEVKTAAPAEAAASKPGATGRTDRGPTSWGLLSDDDERDAAMQRERRIIDALQQQRLAR
jgi:hypothetical protein